MANLFAGMANATSTPPQQQQATSTNPFSGMSSAGGSRSQPDPLEGAVKKNPNAWGAISDMFNHVSSSIGSGLGKVAGGVLSNESNFSDTMGTAGAAALGADKPALESMGKSQEGQDALYKQISQMKKDGKDTTRAEQQYKNVTGISYGFGLTNGQDMSAGNILGKTAEKTNEQILGEGLGVATDVLSAGGLETGAKKVGTMTAGKLALQGAKTGAIIGGAQGVSKGMQANKDLGGVAGEGAIGGVVGGAVGGAVGYIAGKIKPTDIEKTNAAIENLNPATGKKLTGEAIAQGRATEGGFFKDASIEPSKRATELGTKYPELLQSKSAIVNTNKVLKAGKATEDELQKVLTADAVNMPTDKASQLAIKTGVNKAIDDSVSQMPRGLKNQTKEYQDFLDWSKEIVGSKDATPQGIIEARRALDAQVKKEYPNIIDATTGKINEASPITGAWRAVRNSLNKYAYNMSGVSEQAQSLIQKESDLFDIGRILKTPAIKEAAKKAGIKEIVNPVVKASLGGGAVLEGARKVITGNW